jgi:hypothetical protein
MEMEVTRMRRVQQLASAVIVGALLLGASTGLALGQTSTDTEVDLSPNPEQCNQAPRTLEEIEAALGSATPAPEMDTQAPDGFEIPTGEEASAEMRGGIVETIVQIVACGNARDPLAALGGYTDELFASLLAAGMFGDDPVTEFAATPVALSEETQTQLLDTREFTLYDDGRVGVLVYYRVPTGPAGADAPVEIALWIFAQEDGRWLVDEMVTGLEAQLGDIATPPAG